MGAAQEVLAIGVENNVTIDFFEVASAVDTSILQETFHRHDLYKVLHDGEHLSRMLPAWKCCLTCARTNKYKVRSGHRSLTDFLCDRHFEFAHFRNSDSDLGLSLSNSYVPARNLLLRRNARCRG